MVYRIEVHRAAQKQILALPGKAQLEVARAIDRLAGAPKPAGSKRLRGTELWRLRLGRYRVVYFINDETRLVTVVKVAPRREDTEQGL